MNATRSRSLRGVPPKTVRLPSVGELSPAMSRSIVDFPAPFSPSSNTEAPGYTRIEMLLSAAKLPYRRETPESSTAGCVS